MKQKFWLILFFSIVIGCGSGQTADGGKQTENIAQTEVLKQEDDEQTEMQKQIQIPEQSEIDEMVYTSVYLGNIDDIAVTEDGRLYATSFLELNQSYNESKEKEFLVITQPTLWLYEFASNGTCVCLGEILYAPREAMALEQSDDFLYVMVPGVNEIPVLYQVGHLSEVYSDVAETYKKSNEADETGEDFLQKYHDFDNLDIWTLQELYRFDTFSEITRLVFLGDRLYVYGTLGNPDDKSLVQDLAYGNNNPNTDKRQAVGYLDMKNVEAGVTILPMNGIPQDIIKFDENTLGIYLAGEDAASFWKYIPENETWEQTNIAEVKSGGTVEDTASYSKFAAYANGCFYVKNGNVVCYKTVAGTEQELFESDSSVKGLKTDGTYLYYYSDEWTAKEVRRIGISGLLEGETE